MLVVHISNSDVEDLQRDLADAGVEFSRRRYPVGQVMNCSETIEIATVGISAAVAVLIAWLKYRPTRKLMVRTKKDEVITIEANSVKEAEELLESARSIIALDPKKKSKAK